MSGAHAHNGPRLDCAAHALTRVLRDCSCADVAPAVASAPAPAAAAAAASVALASASSSAPVLPLQQRLSDPAALKSFYSEHGYVLERGVPEAKQLFSEIAAAKPRSAKFSTFIAGKMVQLDTLAAKAADAAKGLTISMLTMAIALAIATTNKVSACSVRVASHSSGYAARSVRSSGRMFRLSAAVQYTGVPIAHLAAASVKILSCKAGEGEQLGKHKRASGSRGWSGRARAMQRMSCVDL